MPKPYELRTVVPINQGPMSRMEKRYVFKNAITLKIVIVSEILQKIVPKNSTFIGRRIKTS
jgi:hypothetical protein